jgi:TBC1 domain family member 24
MCILAHDFPQLSYCPALMPTATLLLEAGLDADATLGCLGQMLRASLHAHDWRYFVCSPREAWLFAEVFLDLVEATVPAVYRHALKLHGGNGVARAALSEQWRALFGDWFRGHLPLTAAWRLMDSFVLEGLKVLLRLALAVLDVGQATLLQATSKEALADAVHAQLAACTTTAAVFETVWRVGFALPLARKDLSKARDRNQERFHSVAPRVSHADLHLRQLPTLSAPSTLLTDDHVHALWKWVPTRLRDRDLDLLFDTATDGYSLRTLYDRCAGRGPLLLVARTTADYVLGAYLSTPLAVPQARTVAAPATATARARATLPSANTVSYTGDGETFVFTLLPPPVVVYPWARMNREAMAAERARAFGGGVVYRGDGDPVAAAANDYFVLADHERFSVGGGRTGPALSLDDLLSTAHTGPCETFGSPGLHGPDHIFTVAEVEVFVMV